MKRITNERYINFSDMKQEHAIGIGISILFLIGLGVIVYQGRPVMDLKEQYESEESEGLFGELLQDDNDADADADDQPRRDSSVQETGTDAVPSDGALSFSMADVTSHNTKDDCWTAIDGAVYDLTSWVSRHPGGSGAITRLCGTDGSESFSKVHGRSPSAARALGLLKIGSLE